jgi:hypothetical protein
MHIAGSYGVKLPTFRNIFWRDDALRNLRNTNSITLKCFFERELRAVGDGTIAISDRNIVQCANGFRQRRDAPCKERVAWPTRNDVRCFVFADGPLRKGKRRGENE